MVIRLKVKRLEEQRISKMKDLMEMFRVPSIPTYQYQPVGGSSLGENDPRIQATKNLFQMFHIER